MTGLAFNVRMWTAAAVITSLAQPLAARPQGGSDNVVVVGSKGFTENRILAELMAQLIEAHSELRVERRPNLTGTQIAFAALRSGEIDIYPEYTGTGWAIILGLQERVSAPLRAYVRVRSDFMKRFDIEWLQPFGFSNSYALAMDRGRAKELGITRISQLAQRAKQLRVGFSHEFLNRSDGYIGLSKMYNLRFVGAKGMDHGLAYEAIRSGRVDIVDTWTTDGKLLRFDLRILDDDKGFFPPYDAAPVVRAELLRRHPQLRAVIERLAFRLPDKTMQQLNAAVEDRGGSFAAVARGFLIEQGMLDPTTRDDASASGRPGLWKFVVDRSPITTNLVGQHLVLTGIAVLLAILLSVPLGIFLTRQPRFAGPVLNASGVIQTIPSLALLAFMIPIPFLGLGSRSAIAALFLYALLPILRNTFTGIRGVDPELVMAARAIGLSERQILLRVQLPLATRTIMAGIRTSTVISVGVATLAAFIGAGGLGDPIVTGLQLNDTRLILSGAVPAAGLAIASDLLLGRLESWLTPRGAP